QPAPYANRLSAATSTPRFHKVPVAKTPSGRATIRESIVPATAVPIVCATARSAVRRNSGDRSGGKSWRAKFQIAVAVAGRNKTPGRISANRQDKTSNANAETADSIPRYVING